MANLQSPTYSATGTKAAAATKLAETVFGVTVENHELLKLAYLATLDNQRPNLAKTLTRGEVRGGGKKPWKQKGTGRARFGSIRVPIWRGGGIALGPTGNENYSKKINTSAKRLALLQALSLAHKQDKVAVVTELAQKDNKTSAAAKLVATISNGKAVCVVYAAADHDSLRAYRNLPMVTLKNSAYLTVNDVLDAGVVLFSAAGLQALETRLGGK